MGMKLEVFLYMLRGLDDILRRYYLFVYLS